MAALLGACSVVTTVRGPAPGFRRDLDRRVTGTDLVDFKGIVHCHSYLSHDSTGTIEAIAAAAAEVGVDFIVMTDHITDDSVRLGKRGMQGRTLFLVGAELRTPGGTLLAFPLRTRVSTAGSTAEIIARIHAEDGLAVVGHAERFTGWEEPGIDGMEILNLHAAALDANRLELLFKLLFTPVHLLLDSLTRRPDANLAKLDALLAEERYPFIVVGGTDAHDNLRLGPFGTIANYRELFRVMTTHVLAKGLEREALLDGFRSARTYVAIDLHRDATGFDFRAEDAAGAHLMGASVAESEALALVVKTPAWAEIRLLRNGRLVSSRAGRELRLASPPPGVYRVECYLSGSRPWVFSSPIRVTARGVGSGSATAP